MGFTVINLLYQADSHNDRK